MKQSRILLASLFLLSACVDNGYRPVALQRDFGKSVHQLTQAQILNPKAAVHPPVGIASKKGLDGMSGQSVIGTYRTSFGQAQPTQPITINVGSGSSGSSSSSG